MIICSGIERQFYAYVTTRYVFNCRPRQHLKCYCHTQQAIIANEQPLKKKIHLNRRHAIAIMIDMEPENASLALLIHDP